MASSSGVLGSCGDHTPETPGIPGSSFVMDHIPRTYSEGNHIPSGLQTFSVSAHWWLPSAAS